MKKYLGTLAVLAGLVTAGCSSGQPIKTVVEAATTSSSATTTTSMAPITTTTVCVIDTTTAARQLQVDQARLDSLVSGRRTAESGVAQIQLVIDNATRSIESHRRTLATAQAAYDQAAATYADIKWDTYYDRMVVAADRLADWKGIVASWEAVRTKALGDLARGKATLADWDKQISAARQAVATDRAAPATMTCS
jgi:hypothetical protein